MSPNLPKRDAEASVFPTSGVTRRRSDDGVSHAIFRLKPFPTIAPWSELRWGLPLVLVGNVVVATLAWMVVRWVMS